MIDLVGIFWFAASALSLWYGLNSKQQWARAFCHTIFVALAVAMFNHWLPGIHNPKIYDKILLSPDAVPFSLYLNLDKTWIGLLIYVLILRKARMETKTESVSDVRI